MIKAHNSIVRTIMKKDADFVMQDGLVVVPRAGFMINTQCPQSYQTVIMECINNGWLEPVAHVRDFELMMDRLYE